MGNITIIGAGMMGSALTFPASDNKHEIRLVGTPLDRDIIDSVKQTHYHPTLKRTLPESVVPFQIDDVSKAIEGADLIICGVSSFGLDWFCDTILPVLPESVPVLSVTKGMLDTPDGKLIPYPHIFKSKTDKKISFNAVGGPCTSYELADKDPTEVAFCGEDINILRKLKQMLSTSYYHISVSTDVIGVETAVAMKNAYALAVSLSIGLSEKRDGIGCVEHYNSQAALFGQSTREMSKLLKLCGGKDDNLVYACGDLYVTVFGGRTRKIGILLGRGLSFDEAMKELNGITLESIVIATRTARAIKALIQKGSVNPCDFPLLLHIDEIINHNAPVNIPWDKFTVEQQ